MKKMALSNSIEDENLKKYLNDFEGKKIRLPVRKEFYPDKELLKKHRQKWSFHI